MVGIGELAASIGRRLSPARYLALLTEKLQAAHMRARVTVPHSDVWVYSFSKESSRLFHDFLAPGFESPAARTDGDAPPLPPLPPYSLIVTTRNEEASIIELLDSLRRQSAPPSEVVICDGGSRDRTVERIREWEAAQQQKTFTLTLLAGEAVSIAEGRNRAAARASNEILLFADAGTSLDRFWAERLLVPFAHRPSTEAAMGWYRPVAHGALGRALSLFLVPELQAVYPPTFLPSARSVSVKRSIFHAVGGYPTHLTRAGEDTLFDLYLKTAAREFAFVPDAVALWHFPQGLRALAKTIVGYARGDGEGGGLIWSYYLELLPDVGKMLLEIVLALVCVVLWLFGAGAFFGIGALICLGSFLVRLAGVVQRYVPFRNGVRDFKERCVRVAAVALMVFCQAAGFVRGLGALKEVERRRILSAGAGHLVVLLPSAYVLRRDARLDEMLQGYLAQEWYVVLIHASAGVHADGGGIPFAHPRLESYSRAEFDVDGWWRKHGEFLSGNRRFLVTDLCRDSFSKDLERRFIEHGASSVDESRAYSGV